MGLTKYTKDSRS